MAGANRTASFFQSAASILDQIQSSQGGNLPRIWHTVQPWLTRLLASAPVKWLPILSQDSPCFILNPDGNGGWSECDQPAITLCDCCGKPTCLHHGRIDSSGGCICFPCVAIAHKVVRSNRGSAGPQAEPQPQAKKKPEMTVPEALEVLGCTTASTKAEVRKAYKALSKRYHTDTKDTADNAKFIRVQKAWAALQAEK